MTNEDIHAILHQPHIVACENCLFKQFEHTGGHCYMFRRPPDDSPTHNRCGQFRKHIVNLRDSAGGE